MDPQRLVLDLTFLEGGPAADFQRVGQLAQVLHGAPAPFEGHLCRNHLLFSFPRQDEERFIVSCAQFVSALNHEGRAHRGQLVDAVTREYDRGRVHEYALNVSAVPAIVVSKEICDRVQPVFPHPALLRIGTETVVHPFAAAGDIQDRATRADWLQACRTTLSLTAASPSLSFPRFDWLFEILEAVTLPGRTSLS